MDRRVWLLGVGAVGLGAVVRGEAASSDLLSWARQGGVIVIRHASTEAGLGDPPGFALGQCHTQRNLSEAGRQESIAMGAWFRQHGVVVTRVLSSQWCRCQETARLAFGPFQDWPALNSTFAGQGDHETQLRALRDRLKVHPAGTLEVWVTHQVIMTGLTGAFPAMGEAFAVDASGALQARGMMKGNS